MGDRNSLDFRVTYHGGSVSEPQNEAWRTEVVGDQGAPDAEYAVRGWSFATGSACQEGRLLVRYCVVGFLLLQPSSGVPLLVNIQQQ